MSPVISCENSPSPVPICTFVLSVVGFSVVAYTIPRSVIFDPPSAVTSPPNVAEVVVMEVAAAVVSVGVEGGLEVIIPEEPTATNKPSL